MALGSQLLGPALTEKEADSVRSVVDVDRRLSKGRGLRLAVAHEPLLGRSRDSLPVERISALLAPSL